MTRRKARETALQMLFQLDVGQNQWPAAAGTLRHAGLETANATFAQGLVEGALSHLEEVDALINRYAKGWQVERLANVDKTILRLAVYELKYEPQTPAQVAINEAIELAKIFGSDESAAFINGILDTFYNQELAAAAAASNTDG